MISILIINFTSIEFLKRSLFASEDTDGVEKTSRAPLSYGAD